ncbi:MAG: UvrD-helicase domain-containing protein [Gemmatimonadales bacterium]
MSGTAAPRPSDERAPAAAPPPDQVARDRIRTALDVNILVEAGAGSGKTTSLVDRLMAYVERGESVETLAAVTFTRKAAAELRERFQVALETRTREARAKAEAGDAAAVALAEKCERALGRLDGAFLGTIHSFCARLLRERPIAAGLDPSFEEVTDAAWERLWADFWRRWVDERLIEDDPMISELRALGVHPTMLRDGFSARLKYPEVDFSAEQKPKPNVAPVRTALEQLLARALALLQPDEPPGGWDGLQSKCRRLRFLRSQATWREDLGFLDALEELCSSGVKPTLKDWTDDAKTKKIVKQLGEDFEAFVDGAAASLLAAWREHRYPAVMRFLDAARTDFEQERLDRGQLGFEDLLLRARDLLRGGPEARRELGRRYAHVLVDEFQDTDPIQAEVCFLLASDPESGDDWRAVTLRPGALFVVGDPKQSIYRFRRASFDTYRMVKDRFRERGEVLQLTACFRCAPEIARFVEAHFQKTLPAADSDAQAAFAPMQPWGKAAAAKGTVCHYTVGTDGRASRGPVLDADAKQLASWIARRVGEGEAPESFLILTYRRADTTRVVRELGERNIPVSLSGGKFEERDELAELLIVLRALADPDNPVLVAAALEGWCFGLSPLDLLRARDAGLRFTVSQPPTGADSAVGPALARMHGWWLQSESWPLEEVVERLLDETGLLAHAAASELGEARAGSLVKLVEALRESAGLASGLAGLVEAVEESLAVSEGGVQLRPERRDAVRVMNLHKAKGLEADIVVLAAPAEDREHQLTEHVARSGAEGSCSGLLILDEKTVIAQPAGWGEMEAIESRFRAAEEERLRYVAATRARRELVVARLEKTYASGEVRVGGACWAPFEASLQKAGAAIAPRVDAPPGRRQLARSADELLARIEQVAAASAQAGRKTMTYTSVTRSAKAELVERRSEDAAWATSRPAAEFHGRGTEWGSAVHRVIEGLGRGRTGDNLRAFAVAVAVDEGLAATTAEAGPTADELVSVAQRVCESVPGGRLGSEALRRFEWTAAISEKDAAGVEHVTEGAMDCAVLDGGAWRVLDWKTDEVDAATWASRAVAYQAQVDRYAKILTRLRAEPAVGLVVRTPGGSPPC